MDAYSLNEKYASGIEILGGQRISYHGRNGLAKIDILIPVEMAFEYRRLSGNSIEDEEFFRYMWNELEFAELLPIVNFAGQSPKKKHNKHILRGLKGDTLVEKVGVRDKKVRLRVYELRDGYALKKKPSKAA